MEIISYVAEHAASAIDCILVMWIMVSFYEPKKKIPWWKYLVWFIVLFIPVGCLNEYFNLQCVVSIATIFLFAFLELKGKNIEKLIAILGIFIIIAFINVGTIQMISFFGKTPIDVLIVPGSLLRILVLIVSKVTLVTALILIRRFFNKERYFNKEEYILGVVLYLIYTTVATIVTKIMGTVALSFKEQLSFFALTILLFVINLFLIWLIRKMNYQNRCEVENTILKVQLEQQEVQINNTELMYQNARKMRHDMKHYFTTYLQLLNEGEVELVKEEMQKALNTKFDTENVYFMKSKQINAVINQKAMVCKEKEISFDVQISGEFEWRNESNIAILLSNLLDNAIEAEVKENEKKEMKLKMFTYKESVNIIVENRVAESVLEKNPMLKTTKKKKQNHGIGMESIREIVKQEEGTMDISEEIGWFIIHILLPKR